MRNIGFCCTIVLLLAMLVPGCQWLGHKGPVSESLATCRQFSQQGIAAAERGAHEQAEALLAKAVEACPVDPEARRHYAETLWHRGARRKAIAQLEEATRLSSEDATLHVRLAEMHLASGQREAVRQYAEQAIDLNPKLPSAWVIRGRLMGVEGDPQQALADFHRALGYAPDDPQILLEIAELHRRLNRPQRALATLQTLADTYSPGEEPQQVLHLMGLAYLALGRNDDGAESLAAAAVCEEPTAEIFYLLAEAEFLSGRPQQAAAAARHALALRPEHEPSRELLGRLEVAQQAGGLPRR